MAVTKLIKKASRNKSNAKLRVRTIRQSLTRNLVASPYKEESGVVIGTVAEAISMIGTSAPAKKAAKAVKAEAPAAEEATVVVENTEIPSEAAPSLEDTTEASEAAESAE